MIFGFAKNATSDATTTIARVDSSPNASDVGTTQAAEATDAGTTQPTEVLREGDVVRSFAVRWPGGKIPTEFADSSMQELTKKLSEGWEPNERYPLSALIRVMQMLPEGTGFAVMAARDGKIVEATTRLDRTDVAWAERGIGFAAVEQLQTASSVGEAFSLGVRESERRLGDVFGFLALAIQGKVKAKHVGGPITIFRAAGAETSRGMSRLLMFLTMLSMNLAILNFLPIPALDGGHMMFLVAEAVRGRPVDEKLQMQLTMAGVMALLALMAFAIFNDIRQL